MKNNNKTQRFRILILTGLLISIISISGLVAYAMQPASIPLEVKEPLEITDYPTGFSLYAGETTNFDFTVENHASTTIFQEFEFTLNDTTYQSKYVTFSNHNYSLTPGINKLQAWLTISPNAPLANFIITINKKTSEPTPTSNDNVNSSPNPALELLAGGAKWASPNGTKTLYINHKDNWEAHHQTDGVEWGPWLTQENMNNWKTTISLTLETAGFEVTYAGDVPEDLNNFDLVVFEASWAVEPKHSTLVRDYLSTGGGVIIMGGVPCYFSVYCKDRWPYRFGGTDLSSFEDWFGAGNFVNTNGIVRLTNEDSFETTLHINDIIYSGEGSEKSVSTLSNSAHTVAVWNSGLVYAFTHEYGLGRMYYQGEIPRS